MPLHLPALSRRHFLAAVAGALVVRPLLGADPKTDPHRLAFLSDTHIADKPETKHNNRSMADNLKRVVEEVLALDPKPAGVMIDGDLSYKTGTADEYAAFGGLIEPLRKADLPLSLGLGNHDNRDAFLTAFGKSQPKDRPVEGKHVLIVEMERVNLVLLDSLDPKLGANGKCGEKQLEWLAKALDNRPKTPAIVFVHHNPVWKADGKTTGAPLADTAECWKVLAERKQVKALVFGHTHTWKPDVRDDIHLINLPAVGYPFNKDAITGWVDVRLEENGAKLEVRGLDTKHADHGKKLELKWRKG